MRKVPRMYRVQTRTSESRTIMSTATLTVPTSSTTVPAAPTPFNPTANDRCDGCGARAYVRVGLMFTNKAGVREETETLFCAHHFAKHAPALSENPNVLHVTDRRDILNSEEKARVQE
jgi:hypothetical protein